MTDNQLMRQTKVHIVSLLLASRQVLSEQTIKLKNLKLKLDYVVDLVCKQTAITAKRDKQITLLTTKARDVILLESLNKGLELSNKTLREALKQEKKRNADTNMVKQKWANKAIAKPEKTNTQILEAIKRQTNVLISIHNLKNVSKDIEQITCEHPYNRVHQVDEVVYCNKCGTTINK